MAPERPPEMLSTAVIRALIAAGENERVEFKREVGEGKRTNEDISREMAAFANTRGGYLLIGVGDDGAIVGVDQPHGVEERLMNIASEGVVPPIDPVYRLCEIGGRQVACVYIEAGKDKPYSPRYVRRGSTKRRATREEERRLFHEGGFVDFDSSPLADTSSDDLDFILIDSYLRRTTDRSLSDFGIEPLRLLLNKRVLDGRSVTVAGMLMFGRQPQLHLPQSTVKLARFRGGDMSGDFMDRAEVSGPLPEAIESTLKFVQRNTGHAARIVNSRRVEMPEYLPEVVREAVTNAVVHRDYAMPNAHISLFIFDDRIEVRSPGRLPNSATLDILPLGDHHPRNRLLFLFLEALGYGERMGTGIPRMIGLCRAQGCPEPRFEEVGEGFWVTLFGKGL